MPNISYLRHGKVSSGGARHEAMLIGILEEHESIKIKKKITPKIYRGLSNIFLFFWAFLRSGSSVNIVVIRLALSSIFRNVFNNNKTIIIIHHFDKKEHPGILMKIYFSLLFSVLKKSDNKKVAIITVSPYFQKFFQRLFPQLSVYYFPNLFDHEIYLQNKDKVKDQNKILLGQYSTKNEDSVFILAKKLSTAGYKCFFTSLHSSQAGNYNYYEVKHLTFNQYLSEIKTAGCALALPRFNEGWNRLLHECILSGTVVAGYDNGGLGDLLRESNSVIINSVEVACNFVNSSSGKSTKIPLGFTEKYDIKMGSFYAAPIIKFILSGN